MKKHTLLTLMAAVAIAAAPALQAQSTTPAKTTDAPAWNVNVGAQIAQLLASPSPAVQRKGLDIAFSLADRSDLDLSAATPHLVEIYRTSDDERARLAALATLHVIGDEEAMQALRRDVTRQASRRVQVATLGTLASYYGMGTFAQDRELAFLAVDLRDNVGAAR